MYRQARIDTLLLFVVWLFLLFIVGVVGVLLCVDVFRLLLSFSFFGGEGGVSGSCLFVIFN